MNKSASTFCRDKMAPFFLAVSLVFGVTGEMGMSSGLVFAAESEGEEVVEPGKVGRLEEMVEKMVKKHSLAGLGLSLYGYVDVSYIQNFKNPNSPGGGPNINQNRIFDTDSNSFTVHLAQVVLEKEGKAGGALEDAAGFRLKLNWGEDAEFTGGTFAGDDVDFQEAYVQFIAPWGNGLDLRMGRMNTLVGYEVIESPYNPNFSRSWLFGNGQPFTTTGIRGSYDFTDQVSFSVGVINDFAGLVNDTNNTKGVESALSYSPTDWLGLTGYGYFSTNEGPVGNDDGRILFGGIIDIQALESTEFVLEAYYGNQENGDPNNAGSNARWGGFAGYIIHDFTEKWGLRYRGEIYEDADGAFSCFGTNANGGKAASCAPGRGGAGQTLWEMTYTLQYKPVPSLITRVEFRHDKSDHKTFLKGTKAVDNQQTLALEVIYLF